MRDLLSDPRLVDALIGLVLAAIAGVGGLGALVYRRVYARLDDRLSHVLATSIEARRAAETDVFSDIPLDAAPLPGGEDAQAPGDLDSIEF